MGASTDELVDIILDIDLDDEPQCTSTQHKFQPDYHSDGPATHWQITACGHANGLRCAGWVAYVKGGGWGLCLVCGRRNSPRSYRFIEL